ncbi:MAG TPA: zinc-binding dehydrogenase [Anaerolineales bacterium]|nr:zinc-binding dehydrogenase [Anaerolineales bacterium]
MKAVQFNLTIPRYAAGLALRRLSPEILWSGLSCTRLNEITPPGLPGLDWVRIRTTFGGICGTDMGTIGLHTSPYYSPFSAFPFTLGHEIVGRVVETGPAVGGWEPGDRVVVDPLLWCGPRGFSDRCEFCARGQINRCTRITEGVLAAGLMTGTCRDTGGGWSPELVAHHSQLYRIPDTVSDENALLIEPFAVGLHAALAGGPADVETVLILGAGTIGLTTLAALRALGSEARILVLARYEFQAEAAARLGATEVLNTRAGDAYDWVASQTGGRVRRPVIGKRVVSGGAHLTFECVGSDSAIDDALRLTRDGGRMVLAGLPGIARGIDWTALFAQELTVIAARNHTNAEQWNGRRWKAFDLAIHLIETGRVDLSWMLTHRYRLDDFKTALRAAAGRGRSEMIKGVFNFN